MLAENLQYGIQTSVTAGLRQSSEEVRGTRRRVRASRRDGLGGRRIRARDEARSHFGDGGQSWILRYRTERNTSGPMRKKDNEGNRERFV